MTLKPLICMLLVGPPNYWAFRRRLATCPQGFFSTWKSLVNCLGRPQNKGICNRNRHYCIFLSYPESTFDCTYNDVMIWIYLCFRFFFSSKSGRCHKFESDSYSPAAEKEWGRWWWKQDPGYSTLSLITHWVKGKREMKGEYDSKTPNFNG